MKEIIEYILAGIIIISFIPLYTIINTSLYNPPPRRIDPNVMVLYSSVIEEVLDELISTNNFTPSLVDIRELVKQRVGPDIYRDYGFHVSIVSWGIINITLYSDRVSVYTRDLGNLTLLVIRNDLSHEVYLLSSPTASFASQGIYKYDFVTDTSSVIIVIAVLETGITRYIDYYIDNSITRIYILNLNGKIYVLNDLSNGRIKTKYYADYLVVDSYLYYYTKLNFSVYRHLYYEHSIDTYIYSMCCCSNSPTPPNPYLVFLEKEIVPMIYTNISYYSIYDGLTNINGKNYEKLYLASFEYERNYTEYWVRRDIYGGGCSCSEACNGLCPYFVRTSQTFKGSKVYMDIVSSPLYNAVLLLLKDLDGQLYVATFYHNEVEFGDAIPRDWQTDILVYIMRIGMVDYEVTLTIWRRSI